VRSGAGENDFLANNLVDQYPIRLEMAFTVALPLSLELVVVKAIIKALLLGKQTYHRIKHADILSSPLCPLSVSLERAGKAGV
jgi:hypothetical protein